MAVGILLSLLAYHERAKIVQTGLGFRVQKLMVGRSRDHGVVKLFLGSAK